MPETSIAAQLYTVREFAKTPADIASSLKRVGQMGYRAIQCSGLGPIDPTELKTLADGEGLTICATHVGYDRLRDETDAVIDEHRIDADDLRRCGHFEKAETRVGAVLLAHAAHLEGQGEGRLLPRIDDETAANMQVDRDLLVHQKPMSTAAECARTIRTNLMFMNPDSPPRSLLVTSPTPRDGKTTVATSLAISIAQSGRKVLLIDTDLRRPRVHKAFEIPGSIGATSVIIGEKSLGEAASPTMVAGLDVLPCGPIPPNPSELLHGRGFQRLLAEAREKYDRVILDSPPIGAVTDAAIIAPQVDGVIVVVKANRTTRDGLVATVRQLSSVGSVILGSVVNDVDLKASSHGGYYQYYRYDYYGPEVPAGDGQGEAA